MIYPPSSCRVALPTTGHVSHVSRVCCPVLGVDLYVASHVAFSHSPQVINECADRMDRVKENLRRGLILSEQYAGKGTGSVAWAKVAAALEHHGLIDAYDQKMVHGTTIEMKPHALAVTGGIPLLRVILRCNDVSSRYLS